MLPLIAQAARMEGVGMQLLTTLALMFFGALACGCAPFFLRVKDTHLQTVAALGAGLMIGSALAVIIPEGFHAFAEVRRRRRHPPSSLLPHASCPTLAAPCLCLQAGSHAHEHDHDHEEEPGHEEHEEGLPEGLAGLVLICGFLAMLLLDHLQHAAGGSCGTPGHTHAHHHHARSHSHGNGDCVSASAGQERQKDRSPERQAAAGQKGTAAGSSDAGHVGEPRAEAADCTGKAKKGVRLLTSLCQPLLGHTSTVCCKPPLFVPRLSSWDAVPPTRLHLPCA